MGYQNFQKGYEEQIVRLELDSAAISSKTRENSQHNEQGYLKGIIPGITASLFPHSLDSLGYIHKMGGNALSE